MDRNTHSCSFDLADDCRAALNVTGHASHQEQASMIGRGSVWRNNHACDERLHRIIDRANVA